MKVGLCTVISVPEFQVITYVFATYELALAQAIELQKGVTEAVKRQESGGPRRMVVFSFKGLGEVVSVQEAEVGDAVLEVKL